MTLPARFLIAVKALIPCEKSVRCRADSAREQAGEP
jgi:hypothetical protein